MRVKIFAVAVLLAVFVQGAVFAQTAEDYYNRGRECFENGDYYNAMENFNRALQLKPDYAEALNGRGEIYLNVNEYDAAEKDFSAAIKINPKYENALINRGSLYLAMGNLYHSMDSYDRTIADWGKALELNSGNTELKEKFADLYYAIGAQKQNSGDIAGAIEGFTFACSFSSENVDARMSLGILYYNRGNFPKAIECFLEAKTIIEKTLGKDHPYYATSLHNLGVLYQKMSDYTNAEHYLLGAKDIRKKVLGREHHDYAATVYNLGLLYDKKGDYAKAENCYLEAKAIDEKILGKEHPDYATLLNGLGLLYHGMGDYAKAENCYLEARAIYEKALGKEHPYYATSLNNLGLLYHDMGDYANAEHYMLEAGTIVEKVLGKEHPDYAGSLNNLGGLYYSMGDYAKAESCYLEARTIVEKVLGKEHPDYATTLNNLGELYRSRGDYAKAESCYLEARTIVEKVLGKEHPDYAGSLNNLGELYRSRGDYAKAESCHLEARAIREKVLGKEHPDYAGSLNHLGLLYYNRGDYAKAESCYLETRAIVEKVLGKEHPYYATTLDNLYILYLSKKEYTQALTYKQEQIRINTGIVNQNFSFQTEQQRDAYWNAKSVSFEGSYSLSFYHSVPASNVLNYDNALFSKGLLLRTTNAVRDSIYASGNQALIAQFEELGRLRQQISAQRQSGGNEAYIQSLETRAEALDKSLTQSSAAFREFQADLAVNWQSVQKSLQAKEAAIEFVSFRLYDKKWTDKIQYAALVVKPSMKALEWVPLCEENMLAELFAKLEGKCPQEQARILYDVFGPALYNAVWKPLEKVLKGVTTVYYSPSGLLHKVSFSAIPVNAKSRLMDKYGLNLVSSTREVVYLKTKTAGRPNSAVVYGGLDYTVDADTMREEALAYNVPVTDTRGSAVFPTDGTRGGPWNFLGGSLDESRDIQRLLEGRQIRVIRYSGVKGNKESFKALSGKKTSIIHLATHGFFMEDVEKDYEKQERLERLGGGRKAYENQLLRSGLILAGGNNAWTGKPVEGVENGILFADDVAKMNLLGAELIVLSACVTALGNVNNSEGVFGLQRAFKLAGAQTLVMSLWEVNDKATSIIMGEFYRNWLSGMSKQEAFKAAQRSLRKDGRFSEPYFWAAFVMMD